MKNLILLAIILLCNLSIIAQNKIPIFGIAKESIVVLQSEKNKVEYAKFQSGDTIVFYNMEKKLCGICYKNYGHYIYTKDLDKISFTDSISTNLKKLIGEYKLDLISACFYFPDIYKAKHKAEKEKLAQIAHEERLAKEKLEWEEKIAKEKLAEEKRNKKLELSDLVIGVAIDSIELFVSSSCKSEDQWNYITLGEAIFFLKDNYSSYAVLVDGTNAYIKKDDTTKLKLLDNKGIESLNGLDLNHLQVFNFAEMYKEAQELRKYEKELEAHRSCGLWVTDWSWSYPNEYSSNPEIEIEFYNLSSKTIKYITFYFRATNPVKDLVKTLSGSTLQKLKGIGPIEHEKGGKYEFETSYFSKVISSLQIHSIQVQYMDGSSKTYSGSLLDKAL